MHALPLSNHKHIVSHRQKEIPYFPSQHQPQQRCASQRRANFNDTATRITISSFHSEEFPPARTLGSTYDQKMPYFPDIPPPCPSEDRQSPSVYNFNQEQHGQHYSQIYSQLYEYPLLKKGIRLDQRRLPKAPSPRIIDEGSAYFLYGLHRSSTVVRKRNKNDEKSSFFECPDNEETHQISQGKAVDEKQKAFKKAQPSPRKKEGSGEARASEFRSACQQQQVDNFEQSKEELIASTMVAVEGEGGQNKPLMKLLEANIYEKVEKMKEELIELIQGLSITQSNEQKLLGTCVSTAQLKSAAAIQQSDFLSTQQHQSLKESNDRQRNEIAVERMTRRIRFTPLILAAFIQTPAQEKAPAGNALRYLNYVGDSLAAQKSVNQKIHQFMQLGSCDQTICKRKTLY